MNILKKYRDDPRSQNNGKVLPIISNQQMNGYLKEIADLCGITKLLTFHTARHTFAPTVTLSNSVPIESVSKMLGHASIRTTQIYAEVIENKLSEDMRNLKHRCLQSCPNILYAISFLWVRTPHRPRKSIINAGDEGFEP